MTDIFVAEKAKWKVRIMMHFLQKELTKIAKENGMLADVPKGKSIIDVVHEDLRSCPNRGIKKLYKVIVEAGSHMKEQYQMSTIIDLVPFALWVAYHDTAYRDPLFWSVDQILEDKELKSDIAPFVKKPSDWYCPVWHDSMENTEKLRNEGLINAFQLSPDEQQFVPEHQQMIMQEDMRMQAEMEKQLRLRDRNPKD